MNECTIVVKFEERVQRDGSVLFGNEGGVCVSILPHTLLPDPPPQPTPLPLYYVARNPLSVINPSLSRKVRVTLCIDTVYRLRELSGSVWQDLPFPICLSIM